jgi:hypothetical protein
MNPIGEHMNMRTVSAGIDREGAHEPDDSEYMDWMRGSV